VDQARVAVWTGSDDTATKDQGPRHGRRIEGTQETLEVAFAGSSWPPAVSDAKGRCDAELKVSLVVSKGRHVGSARRRQASMVQACEWFSCTLSLYPFLSPILFSSFFSFLLSLSDSDPEREGKERR
jgi:hypothetical protein